MEKQTLKLTIAPIVRVMPSDAEIKWRVVDKRLECKFTFESCLQNGENPKDGLRFKSGLGDEITLTSSAIDNLVIETLISGDK
jgi:hypothetical protein